MAPRRGAPDEGRRRRYSTLELLTSVVARELRDGEVVAFGLHAELMLAAAALAQRMHAPGLVIRHGLRAEGPIRLGPAAWSESRKRARGMIEYVESHDSILNVASPGSPLRFCDVFFVGGLQMDRQGNTNLIGIKGADGRMKVRGPGSIGTTSLATLASRYYLFALEHSRRVMVEEVDYVSVPGWKRRRQAGLAGGPALCLTELAVFDFEGEEMRLRSVHPGVTVDDVLEATGFKPRLPGEIPETPPPTVGELRLLRQIDPEGRLRQTGSHD